MSCILLNTMSTFCRCELRRGRRKQHILSTDISLRVLTLSLPCLLQRHSENLQWQRFVAPFSWARERISVKMHSVEWRSVVGPPTILFGGVYVCTFQSGNFTGCGSEGVNCEILGTVPWFVRLAQLSLSHTCHLLHYLPQLPQNMKVFIVNLPVPK